MKHCPVTVDYFRKNARPIAGTLGFLPVECKPKEFRGGSFGFYHGAKMTFAVGGQFVECQVGIVITCVGSKPKV